MKERSNHLSFKYERRTGEASFCGEASVSQRKPTCFHPEYQPIEGDLTHSGHGLKSGIGDYVGVKMYLDLVSMSLRGMEVEKSLYVEGGGNSNSDFGLRMSE